MADRKKFSFPVVGGVTLLVMFAVLCMTVFAVLSIGTVQADGRLAEASVQAVKDYYEADTRAERIFASLRVGEVPGGVEETDGLYRYACAISDTQRLYVTVQNTPEGWRVLQWQAVSDLDWQEDDSLPVWDGTTLVE